MELLDHGDPISPLHSLGGRVGHGVAHEAGHHEGDHADLSGEDRGPAVGAGGEDSQVNPWEAA